MKNDKGETITSRKGIANVFGEFCSMLYAETQLGEEIPESQNMDTRTSNEKESCSEDVKNEIAEFTQDEVQAAIDKLKKGKTSDNNGIPAEDIKTTKEMLRQVFNEVLKQDDCTPETWRRIRIKVIYKKKGNAE